MQWKWKWDSASKSGLKLRNGNKGAFWIRDLSFESKIFFLFCHIIQFRKISFNIILFSNPSLVNITWLWAMYYPNKSWLQITKSSCYQFWAFLKIWKNLFKLYKLSLTRILYLNFLWLMDMFLPFCSFRIFLPDIFKTIKLHPKLPNVDSKS